MNSPGRFQSFKEDRRRLCSQSLTAGHLVYLRQYPAVENLAILWYVQARKMRPLQNQTNFQNN